MEFIISEYIRVHPLALLHPEKVDDPEARRTIDRLTQGYPDGSAFFVERLSEGIGTIAAAFWPKPVVVRMSDFKTNEYASLLGGAGFEPSESNPMLGFRGASRYAHPAYAEGFALECRAMRRVRDEMGLTNVILMLPFVRRVAEADLVLQTMADLGLRRGENGLKVYAMCEIPNNVILIDEFAKRFDGFSIGSNDLTQLTLGVDRDSEIVAFDYDERDEGVKEMIRLAVEGCRRNGIHSGLCGQAPSDYPDMAEFLVRLGIDSMSLNPDTVVKTTRQVLELEHQLVPSPRHEAADHHRPALPRRGALRPRRCADQRRAALRGDRRPGPEAAGHRRRGGGLFVEPAVSAGLEGRRDRRPVRRLHRRNRRRTRDGRKPDPAVLLEAARRLGVRPQRCVVVENSDAGVAAGRDGGFALVIGIDGTGHADDLPRDGADVVLADLADVAVRTGDKRISELPNALASYGQLIGITSARESMLFLDYDGTLSPIVSDPGAARLVDGAAEALELVAGGVPGGHPERSRPRGRPQPGRHTRHLVRRQPRVRADGTGRHLSPATKRPPCSYPSSNAPPPN